MKDFVLVKRLSDGKILDIPIKDQESTLKRGGFELVPEEEAIEVKNTGIGCPLCSRTFKNDRGLRVHKSAHQ